MPYGRDIPEMERLALQSQLQELFGEKQGYSDQNYSNGMSSFGMNSFAPHSQNNNLLDRLKEFMSNYNNMQYNNGSSY